MSDPKSIINYMDNKLLKITPTNKLVIDCGDCQAPLKNPDICADCVVSYLLETAPSNLVEGELTAISNLADQGLLPPLRYLP
jgi:hypothetical protein